MIYIKRDIEDKELIKIIGSWIDVLAEQKYKHFFDSLGYSMGGDKALADWVPSDLSRYRSELYPGVTEFKVTDWRMAQGGYTDPLEEVVWYEPNDSQLAGAITYHLPLNGKWSDCTADFIMFETKVPEGFLLRLEEINVPIH